MWDKREATEYIGLEARLLRPFNYAAGAPGRGAGIFAARDGVRVAVVNAMGRVHMPLVDDPFALLPPLLDTLRAQTPIVFVDFHAEVTSEKVALGWHVDGRVSALVGTHTHVQTADERMLPKHTAYMTDLGMTGGLDGIIGMKAEISVERQLTQTRGERMQPADGDLHLQGAVVEIDVSTGLAKGIERVSVGYEKVLSGMFGKKR